MEYLNKSIDLNSVNNKNIFKIHCIFFLLNTGKYIQHNTRYIYLSILLIILIKILCTSIIIDIFCVFLFEIHFIIKI